MSVWAATSQWAVTLQICSTLWSVGVEAKPIFTLQELAEIEAIHSLSDLLNVCLWCHRG
jgi:hypothetical protein